MEGCWVSFDLESKAHRVYFLVKQSVSVKKNIHFEPEIVSTVLGIQSEGEVMTKAIPNVPKLQEKLSTASIKPAKPPTMKSKPIPPFKSLETLEKSSID